MSLRDFREIGGRNDTGKAERLFKAAVSAFCSLTRPSRRDLAQLDDLTLPLFTMVSVEARRYIAAVLSECEAAPPGLLARLADERIDIAAPLLVRSKHLSDIALIALIARHGIGHARAIARRPNLNPTIAQLIRALESSIPGPAKSMPIALSSQPDPLEKPLAPAKQSSEEVRHHLRGMMRADMRRPRHAQAGPAEAENSFRKLRDAALTGDESFFRAALANALVMNVTAVGKIFDGRSISPLLAALRSLDVSEEQAYLVAAAAMPRHFSHPEAIRLFLTGYRALDRDTAIGRVRGWKLEMVANWISRNSTAARSKVAASEKFNANEAGRVFKAS